MIILSNKKMYKKLERLWETRGGEKKALRISFWIYVMSILLTPQN